MKCMFCGGTESKVLDSRPTDDGMGIRRRRECASCGNRFTTYETVVFTPVLVIKSSGKRQAFDENKIKNGIIKSCEKRPVAMQEIDDMVDRIKKKITNSLVQEITSKQIGEMVMEELKTVDEVAYIRFAAVYRQFKDTESFLKEIEALMRGKPDSEET
ncbi:MAG: transcriptional repressor NrdR [Clostridia bacterium]|nr:transcriptional repressor NrdR [Clostridia bacterium]